MSGRVGAAASLPLGDGIVARNTADDYASNPSTSGRVAVDSHRRGAIEEAGDEDWFAVNLRAGETYRIDLKGAPTASGNLLDPYLRGVYNGAGRLIAGTENDDGGVSLNSQVRFTAERSGTYYVAAGAYDDDTGSYRLSVTDLRLRPQDDYASNPSTSGRVAVDSHRRGAIEEAGDEDWFAVNLRAGETYRIDLKGAPTASGNLLDPYLRGVYNGAGRLIAGTENDDGGVSLNSQVRFTAERSGTYYVAAGAYDDDTGSYRLSVTDLRLRPQDDYASNPSTSGRVAVDSHRRGAIEEAGDEDWFAVNLRAGETYRIDLKGAPTASGNLLDPYLRGVYNGAGRLIAGTENDDGGVSLNSQVRFTAERSGTYYVAAGAYDDDTGSYRLSVTDLRLRPQDDYASNPSTSGRVAVDSHRRGAIEEAGDEDWFAVNLRAGETYRIDLKGAPTASGNLLDPYLRGVYNGAGRLIAGTENDDGGVSLNSQVRFTAERSGTYYVAAGAYDDDTGSYRLSVDRIASNPPPTGSAFDISVAFSGNPSFRRYFDRAADRWEAAIVGDLPDVNSRFGRIDDLRIDASVVPIDGRGNILGQAGPTEFRNSALPFAGTMQFDEADLSSMAADGILQEVIEHEMGHVLGLGTLWDFLGLRDGFRYIGQHGVREYERLAGSAERSVPLERDGGVGTAGSHWSESVFDRELMTGYSEPTAGMPTSRVTIAALRDLGYRVDLSAADPFALGRVAEQEVAIGSAAFFQIADPVALSGTKVLTEFSGARGVFYEDTPMSINLNGPTTPIKLLGTLTSASTMNAFFFTSSNQQEYLVELLGNFEKSNPSSINDIKGTLVGVNFYNGGVLAQRYDFSDRPLDVSETLEDWRGLGHNRNNYIEFASNYLQANKASTGAGTDIVIGGIGTDFVRLGAGADEGQGRAGSDVLYGNGGPDLLFGGAGSDRLFGGIGDDTIAGGPGNDTLSGGNGDDILRGHGGRDLFIFADGEGRDVVRDFTDDYDTIQLDSSLWTGNLTTRQVVNQFGRLDDGWGALLEFGDGEQLLLRGVADLSTLYDDIMLV